MSVLQVECAGVGVEIISLSQVHVLLATRIHSSRMHMGRIVKYKLTGSSNAHAGNPEIATSPITSSGSLK